MRTSTLSALTVQCFDDAYLGLMKNLMPALGLKAPVANTIDTMLSNLAQAETTPDAILIFDSTTPGDAGSFYKNFNVLAEQTLDMSQTPALRLLQQLKAEDSAYAAIPVIVMGVYPPCAQILKDAGASVVLTSRDHGFKPLEDVLQGLLAAKANVPVSAAPKAQP